ERLSERERPDRDPRRLPHRRRAERDADVAGRHQRPEPRLVDELLAHDRWAPQKTCALEPSLEVEERARRADEQQPRIRMRLEQPVERLQKLRDPLARVEIAEAADQRTARDRSRSERRRLPGRMRYVPDLPLEPCIPGALLDVARMHDEPRGEVEDLPGERE